MNELEKIRKEKLKNMLSKRKNSIIEVNDQNFQEKVIEKSKKIYIVVDFWSNWCAPCLMLGPILEKLAKEYNGKFILAKANVEKSRKISQIYGIMSIPSVKMFKDGKIIDEFIGAIPEPMVRKWLDKNIGD
jgi:putative thioredoxin